LKSVLSTDRDLKEAAMIEQSRLREEERKKRFFDEKQRVLGIDCDWLNKQLIEKTRKKEEDDEQERLAAEEMRRNLEIAEARENEMQEQKKKAEIELNQFRKKHQQKKDSSDFDLFDSNGLKKSLPARVDDNDARLSISGGQMFIGEDLKSQKRHREQQQLQKYWLDQQIAERNTLKANRKIADDKIGEGIAKHDSHTVFLGNRMNEDKREIQRQIRDYNQMMAQQKQENDKKRRQMEQNDNLAEIYNFLSSDLLQENQPKGSSLGSQRCIPYMYKGNIKFFRL
jgi:RIB43A